MRSSTWRLAGPMLSSPLADSRLSTSIASMGWDDGNPSECPDDKGGREYDPGDTPSSRRGAASSMAMAAPLRMHARGTKYADCILVLQSVMGSSAEPAQKGTNAIRRRRSRHMLMSMQTDGRRRKHKHRHRHGLWVGIASITPGELFLQGRDNCQCKA